MQLNESISSEWEAVCQFSAPRSRGKMRNLFRLELQKFHEKERKKVQLREREVIEFDFQQQKTNSMGEKKKKMRKREGKTIELAELAGSRLIAMAFHFSSISFHS